MKKFYSIEIEAQMRHFFESLPELKRSQYAVIETDKIGHGGASYISNVLGISRKPIYNGRKKQSHLEDSIPDGRQRRVGGGRKKNV